LGLGQGGKAGKRQVCGKEGKEEKRGERNGIESYPELSFKRAIRTKSLKSCQGGKVLKREGRPGLGGGGGGGGGGWGGGGGGGGGGVWGGGGLGGGGGVGGVKEGEGGVGGWEKGTQEGLSSGGALSFGPSEKGEKLVLKRVEKGRGARIRR